MDDSPYGPGETACLQCIGAYKLAEMQEEVILPVIYAAVTMSPLPTPFGAVAVPTCFRHIAVTPAGSQLIVPPGPGLPHFPG